MDLFVYALLKKHFNNKIDVELEYIKDFLEGRINEAIKTAEELFEKVNQGLVDIDENLKDINLKVDDELSEMRQAVRALLLDVQNELDTLKIEMEKIEGASELLEEVKGSLSESEGVLQNIEDSLEDVKAELERAKEINEKVEKAFSELYSKVEGTLNYLEDIVEALDQFKHVGEWEEGVHYLKNNEVIHNGSTYRALVNVFSEEPSVDALSWQLIAQRGVDGEGAVSSVNNVLPDEKGNVDLGDLASKKYVDDKIGDVDLSELDAHIASKENPHGVTKSQVGLGNVQNYSIATSEEAKKGEVDNKYMTPLKVLESLISNIEGVLDEIVVMKEHLPSDAGLEDFPRGVSVGYTNQLGDNYPQRWGTLVNFKTRSDLVMAQFWFGNGGGTGTTRHKLYYRIYNKGRDDLKNGWSPWYKALDELDISDSTSLDSSVRIASSKAVKYLNDSLIDTHNQLKSHESTSASETKLGHVKLTDDITSEHSVSRGYAVTPKGVYDVLMEFTEEFMNLEKTVSEVDSKADKAQKRANEAFTLGNKVKQDLADTLLSYDKNLPVEGANWSNLINYVDTSLQDNLALKVEFLEWVENFIVGNPAILSVYKEMTGSSVIPPLPPTQQGKKDYSVYHTSQIIDLLLKKGVKTASGNMLIKSNTLPPNITLDFLPKTFKVSFADAIGEDFSEYAYAKIIENYVLAKVSSYGEEITLGGWEMREVIKGKITLVSLAPSGLNTDIRIKWEAMSF